MREPKLGFHFTLIENSPAQKRILKFLSECRGRGATTREIGVCAEVEAVSTWISSINHNPGGPFITRRYEGTTENGSRVHRYWLIEHLPREQEAAA